MNLIIAVVIGVLVGFAVVAVFVVAALWLLGHFWTQDGQ